jgi:hypothetical protein
MLIKPIKQQVQQYPRVAGLLICCLVAVAVGIATPLALYRPVIAEPTGAATDTSPTQQRQPANGVLQKGTPDYDTVLPSGKTIKEYGGWTRVSPPNRDPVYAYADKVGSTPIIVSQQPLPKDFAEQPSEQVQLLAQGYAANKKLQVGDVTAYLGTSAKGPQSVIFVKNKLLILIKASASVPDDTWSSYIKSLAQSQSLSGTDDEGDDDNR